MSENKKTWSMRLASAGAAIGLLAAAFGTPPVRASSAVHLSGNVASWVSQAHLLNRAASGNRVGVTVYLRLRHEAQLRSFLREAYQPGSPEYHHFLTPQQFHARFSPTPQQLESVRQWLAQTGLKVGNSPANRTYADAIGTVGQIESAFRVTENEYRYRGMTLRANAGAPIVPAALSSTVSFISGLDQSNLLIKPSVEEAPPGEGYGTPGPCSQYWADHTATVSPSAHQYGSSLPWLPCGYTPPQIRAAYGVNHTALTGAGVRIGIVDAFASNTIVQDVNMFSAHYGLPSLSASNFRQVVAPGIFNFPGNKQYSPQGWFGEETLDIEIAHAMAPGATIVYGGAQNDRVPLDHTLIYMIDNHLADVISNSWGYYGEPTNYGQTHALDQAFLQAAAEGISVLASSGDSGDVAAYTGVAQASYPASNPWVTAVGGTSLALYDGSGTKNEWGWGTYSSTLTGSAPTETSTAVTGTAWTPWPPTFFYGSGGGASLHYAQPWYQQGVVPSALSTSTTTASGTPVPFSAPHRVVPDVAMDADPNTGILTGETYAVSSDPLVNAGCTALTPGYEYCERRIGGTSVASPMFAGVVALADQARFQASEGPIGFLNPVLYQQTPVGAPGSGFALEDVLPPASPMAMLRNVESASSSSGLTTTLRTINSVPSGTDGSVIEGADSSLRTTPGYDDVTGLGTPYVPAFVTALAGAHAYQP